MNEKEDTEIVEKFEPYLGWNWNDIKLLCSGFCRRVFYVYGINIGNDCFDIINLIQLFLCNYLSNFGLVLF